MRAFPKERLPNVSPKQWGDVDAFFLKPRTIVTPGDVVHATGLAAGQALALLDCLAIDRAVKLVLQVFHASCEFPQVPILKRPVSAGMPSFPIRCSTCEQDLDEKDVSFEIAAKIIGQLPRFVDDT